MDKKTMPKEKNRIIKIDVNENKNISSDIKKILENNFKDKYNAEIGFYLKESGISCMDVNERILDDFKLETVEEYVNQIESGNYKNAVRFIDNCGYVANLIEYSFVDSYISRDFYNKPYKVPPQVKIIFTIDRSHDSLTRTNWNIIYSIADIVKSPYNSMSTKKLAMFLCLSESSLNRYVKITEFRREHLNDDEYVKRLQANKVYILSSLNEPGLKDFLYKNMGYSNVGKLSDPDLRKLVKDYKEKEYPTHTDSNGKKFKYYYPESVRKK